MHGHLEILESCIMNEKLRTWSQRLYNEWNIAYLDEIYEKKREELIKIGNGMKLQNVWILA